MKEKDKEAKSSIQEAFIFEVLRFLLFCMFKTQLKEANTTTNFVLQMFF